MSTHSLRFIATALLTSLAAMPAFAHTGHDHVFGLTSGLVHPLTGPDHVLAMIGVGALAGRRGGRALWALPLCFLAFMAIGAGVALSFAPQAANEVLIALSLIVLGALVAGSVRLPLAVVGALIAGFALAHGHGHGAELPDHVSMIGYFAGFLAMTALLHMSGVLLCVRLRAHQAMQRAAGFATVLAGFGLLALRAL